RLQLDASPAQANLLQETQLVVARRGWHAVGELDVLGVVLVEDWLARLGRRGQAGLMQGSGRARREGRLQEAPAARARVGPGRLVGVGSHGELLCEDLQLSSCRGRISLGCALHQVNTWPIRPLFPGREDCRRIASR